MAKTFGSRPSALVGLTARPAAEFFDAAVFVFGSELEADLERTVASRKTQAAKSLAQNTVMDKWLRIRRLREPQVRR